MTRTDYLYFGGLILGLIIWAAVRAHLGKPYAFSVAGALILTLVAFLVFACTRAVHKAPPEPEEVPRGLQERPTLPAPLPKVKPPRPPRAKLARARKKEWETSGPIDPGDPWMNMVRDDIEEIEEGRRG